MWPNLCLEREINTMCSVGRVRHSRPASVTLPWCGHSGMSAAFCTLFNGSVGIRPGGNPGAGAGARMGRMAAAAGAVPARISNMERIPAHGGWLQARERSAPCAGTR